MYANIPLRPAARIAIAAIKRRFNGTSYWIEVTGWEEPVVGYRCENGQGCFAVEDFRVNNVADFINDKIEFTFN